MMIYYIAKKTLSGEYIKIGEAIKTVLPEKPYTLEWVFLFPITKGASGFT